MFEKFHDYILLILTMIFGGIGYIVKSWGRMRRDIIGIKTQNKIFKEDMREVKETLNMILNKLIGE